MFGFDRNFLRPRRSLSRLCEAFREGGLNEGLGDRFRSFFLGRAACWLDRALGDRLG